MRLFAEQRGRGDAVFRRHDAHEDRRDLGADDVVIRLEGAVCIGAVDDAGAVEFVDGLLLRGGRAGDIGDAVCRDGILCAKDRIRQRAGKDGDLFAAGDECVGDGGHILV